MSQDNRLQDVTYEPPQIERVLTSEQLAREVQYAGNGQTIVADDITG